MNMKGFAKSKTITVVIVALVAVALVVTMVFLLKGQPEDKPTQGDGTSQTDTSSTPSEDDDTSKADPTDTSKPNSSPKYFSALGILVSSLSDIATFILPRLLLDYIHNFHSQNFHKYSQHICSSCSVYLSHYRNYKKCRKFKSPLILMSGSSSRLSARSS